MGMYDEIKYEMNCPTCGKIVKNFQSKDRNCLLENLDYWEVNCFYTSCYWCNTWIEFNLKGKRPFIPITDYEMSHNANDHMQSRLIRDEEGRIMGFRGKSE